MCGADAQKETFCAERELTVVQNLNTIEERIRAKEAEMEQLRIAIDGKTPSPKLFRHY